MELRELMCLVGSWNVIRLGFAWNAYRVSGMKGLHECLMIE
jgi:hypothetical protein